MSKTNNTELDLQWLISDDYYITPLEYTADGITRFYIVSVKTNQPMFTVFHYTQETFSWCMCFEQYFENTYVLLDAQNSVIRVSTAARNFTAERYMQAWQKKLQPLVDSLETLYTQSAAKNK